MILRNKGITAPQLTKIMTDIDLHTKVLSLSYNHFGDEDALILSQKLPLSIKELGLVDCHIGEKGGFALLEWVKKADSLTMLCIEHNNFSDDLQKRFREVTKSIDLYI